jgi:hypothetical protein
MCSEVLFGCAVSLSGFVKDECTSMEDWTVTLKGKTEALGDKLVPVPLCPP